MTPANSARLSLSALIFSGAVSATPIQLISNGDFSAGLTGWTVTDQAGGSGSWFASTVGTSTPISGSGTSAAGGGVGDYAVTDQGGPGAHALSQLFTVGAGATTVGISFDLFANDQSGAGPLGTTLDSAGAGPNQHVQVDVLTSGADPLSTSGADLVVSLLLPMVDPVASNPNPFTSYAFDISAFVGGGGTFQLRFGEVDNQFFFNTGVDNVSVTVDAVPEPRTVALMGAALFGVIGVGKGRRRS